MAAAVNTRPPALTMGPPRVMVPVFLPGIQLPSGTSQTFFPEKRSTAATLPQGGALHGSPLGARRGAGLPRKFSVEPVGIAGVFAGVFELCAGNEFHENGKAVSVHEKQMALG